MIAFDTDVLSELFRGNSVFLARAAIVPASEQSAPIVVVEEILRGRLHAVRLAESGKGRLSIEQSYARLVEAMNDLKLLNVLPYSDAAHQHFLELRRQRIRVSTHDLRIGAICIAAQATLISRNRRHFDLIPGLFVEYWS